MGEGNGITVVSRFGISGCSCYSYAWAGVLPLYTERNGDLSARTASHPDRRGR
jgi:hypothetical protein